MSALGSPRCGHPNEDSEEHWNQDTIGRLPWHGETRAIADGLHPRSTTRVETETTGR